MLRFLPRFISHQEWPFSPHFIAQTTYILSPQTLVSPTFFERLNLPVLILWTNWETGKLHSPCSSMPMEWVTEMPDSELSERSQALCNEHSKLAEAVISLLSLMFLLRLVPCKGWSLEDDQNVGGIIGAIWGQEVELGQGAWWGPKSAPLCKHLTLWALTTWLPLPRPCSILCPESVLGMNWGSFL